MSLNEQVTLAIDSAIGDYMKEQKLSQTQLAAKLDMSANSLRNKRTGQTDWSWSEILTLSNIMGKTPDELSGFREAVIA